MGVGAVLDQEDALVSTQLRDPLGVERDVTADVHEERGARSVLRDLALEVLERHAEVIAIAVDELHARPGADRGERRGHERVRGAQDGFPARARVFERRKRPAGPAAERHGGKLVPRTPDLLEAAGPLALGPLLVSQDRVPDLEHALAVPAVEADRELAVVALDRGRGCGGPRVHAAGRG